MDDSLSVCLGDLGLAGSCFIPGLDWAMLYPSYELGPVFFLTWTGPVLFLGLAGPCIITGLD